MLETLIKIIIIYALIIWLGGTLHLVIAVVPTLIRYTEDKPLRFKLISAIMRKFNKVSWTALITLLLATILLSSISLSRGNIIQTLVAITLVAAVTVLDFIHSFIYGPAASKGGSEHARKRAVTVARVETLLAILIPAVIFTL